VLSARERAVSSIDELTGAHRRDSGTLELEREIARAKRTHKPLLFAFIDVDGLKARNDLLGHAAGDQLLRSTVNSLRAHLRSYDLIVRFGGDEFVCALLDMSTPEAATRFETINANLAETENGSITVGLAELREEDSLEGVIARADEALYRNRAR
jgi:diguanylate cyclase (GGDEF)-like protein